MRHRAFVMSVVQRIFEKSSLEEGAVPRDCTIRWLSLYDILEFLSFSPFENTILPRGQEGSKILKRNSRYDAKRFKSYFARANLISIAKKLERGTAPFNRIVDTVIFIRFTTQILNLSLSVCERDTWATQRETFLYIRYFYLALTFIYM